MKKRTKKNSPQMKGTANKRIIIIICIIILILIPALIWLLNKPSHIQEPTTLTENPENTNAKITTVNTLTAYHNNTYTFSYPSGWRQLNNNSDTLLRIQPSGTNADSYSTVTIEVLNAQTSSITALTSILRTLKYTETNSEVAGLAAQRYTAVLPAKNGNLHSTIYIFQKNEKIYSLKLEYIQSTSNYQLENQFDQLVNSFSLQ